MGAEDVEDAGEFVEVFTKPNEVEQVKGALLNKGFLIKSAEIFKKPTTLVRVENVDIAKKVLALIEKLEDLDEVQKVYADIAASAQKVLDDKLLLIAKNVKEEPMSGWINTRMNGGSINKRLSSTLFISLADLSLKKDARARIVEAFASSEG